MGRNSEMDLGALERELSRLRRRAVRQKRTIKTSPEAWQKWSATMDEIAGLTQLLG